MQRVLRLLTLGSLFSVLVMGMNPINSRICRLAFLLSLVSLAVLTLILVWPRRPLRYGLLFALAILPLPFLLPGRPVNQTSLHQRYLAKLKSFEGVTYIWGGEGRLGIDCSGLPRKSLREAMLTEGLLTGNGDLIRGWAFHRSHDASARALAGGEQNYVQPLGINGTIRKLDYSKLQAGDLAITGDGVHVLVYFGGDQWIQAEPGIGKVAILDGKKDPIYWFDAPVGLYRWNILSDVR